MTIRHDAVFGDPRHHAVFGDARHAAVFGDRRHDAVSGDARHVAVFGEARHSVRFAGPGVAIADPGGFFELINDTDFALIGAGADRALIQGA